jgi:HAMP domain-containing protein
VRSRLFIKYVVLFVAVVSLALVANGVFDVYFSYQEQKASLVRIQREQAEAAAGKIGQFIGEIESQVGWTTQLPWSASTLEQRRFDALRLLRQVPAITELAEIDSSGHEQLKVSRLAMEVVGSGTDVSKEPSFAEAVAHKVYYGPVYFRRESEPYMTLSLAGTRRDTGVSIAQVNLKLIWDVLSKIKFSGHGRAYVIDAVGRLIAHPDISLVLRNTDMSQLAQVRSARAKAAGNDGEEVEEAEDIAGHKVLIASAPVAPLGWLVFVETPVQEAYAPLYASLQRTGLVLLGALALAFAAGMFLARRMVVPIHALRAGAARLGSGDLGQRIAIKTGDEVEALANQFNDMAGRLQESYANLERKVEERTQELHQRTDELGRSVGELRALGEVSQAVNSTLDLETVLSTIVAKAVPLSDTDAGAIYQDLCRAVGAGDSERAAVPRNRGQRPAARGRRPAQVAVPRQYEPRAAHAAQCHHRLQRNSPGRRYRSRTGSARSRPEKDRWCRPALARPDQRHSRSVEDRSRPNGCLSRGRRARPAARRGSRTHRSARREEWQHA